MKVSAIVIAKNEEKMIANCLDTLRWCNEVIVVDNGSTDSTAELAEHQGATVVKMKVGTFAQLRNKGRKTATSDWQLYVDADERVTPKVKKEILRAMRNTEYEAYRIPRNNIHYGKWMQHGGWSPDYVVRLFRKDALKEWGGEIHEHAVVKGKTGDLTEPLVHLTHRNMVDGLKKSIEWTQTEAKLLYEAHHPKMGMLRFMKIVFTEFLGRYVFRKAWKDGVEGGVESMVQAMNRFLVYEQLWELQRKPSLEETYKTIEKEIMMLWKNENA